MKPTLTDLQGRLAGNKQLRELNPHLQPSPEGPSLGQKPAQDASKGYGRIRTAVRPRRGKKRREMNATETEFSKMLDRWVDSGVIKEWNYEGLTLRWGEGAGLMTYTPDFTVIRDSHLPALGFHPFVRLLFLEIKGAHAWQKDIVKFKAARAHFKLYEFQLHEKTREGWQQTI